METVQRGKGFRCCFPSSLRVLQRTVKLSSQLLRFHDHTQQEGASARAPPLASLVTPAFISLPWTKSGLTVLTTGGKARGTPEGPETAPHPFSSLPLYLLAFLHWFYYARFSTFSGLNCSPARLSRESRNGVSCGPRSRSLASTGAVLIQAIHKISLGQFPLKKKKKDTWPTY